LLDQPPEGIRPSAGQMICCLPLLLRDNLGTAIVFVEPNLETILALAERCVVMEKCQIIAAIPAGYIAQGSVRQHLLIRLPTAGT